MSLVITIHVIACIFLVSIVLVQRGRGGGFVENLSNLDSVFGTKTSTFLTKATTISAVAFFITCLLLALLSVQRSKSLVSGYRASPVPAASVNKPAAALPAAAEEQAPLAVDKPAAENAAQPVNNPPVEKARTAPLPRQGEVK